jgi:DNA-directed RNA polymerase subunit N (RpoN/RPB10)
MATKHGASVTKKQQTDQDTPNSQTIDVSYDGMMISCPTCYKVIGHLYKKYLILLQEKEKKEPGSTETTDNSDIIKALGLTRYCCFPHIMAYPLGLQDYT